MNPEISDLLILLAIVGVPTLIVVLGVSRGPIGRALARRIAGEKPESSALEGVEERLAAIERAVETIAIEVERVGELNRAALASRHGRDELRLGDARVSPIPPSAHHTPH